jgi:hypothetical protein
MCIAIVKPRGVSLAEDRLRVCFENNPDGAGFAIATDAGGGQSTRATPPSRRS